MVALEIAQNCLTHQQLRHLIIIIFLTFITIIILPIKNNLNSNQCLIYIISLHTTMHTLVIIMVIQLNVIQQLKEEDRFLKISSSGP